MLRHKIHIFDQKIISSPFRSFPITYIPPIYKLESVFYEKDNFCSDFCIVEYIPHCSYASIHILLLKYTIKDEAYRYLLRTF